MATKRKRPLNGNRTISVQVDPGTIEKEAQRLHDARCYQSALPFDIHQSPHLAIDDPPVCHEAHWCPTRAAMARDAMARGYTLSVACRVADVAVALSAVTRTVGSFRLRAGFDSINEKLILWFGSEPGAETGTVERPSSCHACSDSRCTGYRNPDDGASEES